MLGKIAVLVMFLMSMFLVSGPVSATYPENIVTGSVYNLKDSKVVAGAEITVVCNNNVKKTTSTYDGSYVVFYPSNKCGRGDKVKISAKKGSLYGKVVETMTDFGLEVDLAIADVFVKRTSVSNPKLQLYGFVDDYSDDVFVRLNNYGGKSDAVLIVTQVNTGEQFYERFELKKNDKVLRVFQFMTMNLVPGENVIELFAQAGDFRATKYISYYNQ